MICKARHDLFLAGLVIMEQKTIEYLNWKGTYAPRASVAYRIWLKRFIEVCGDKDLVKYDVNDIVSYHNWLSDHYGSYSIQLGMIVIKNFFKFCKDRGYKCMIPSLIRVPKMNAKSHRAVTKEEIDRILSVIPTNDFIHLRDSLMIRILWDTGIRVSELCDLDISQIDTNRRSTIIATKKRNNAKRIIVWSKATHKLLLKYLPIRTDLQKVNGASSLFVGRQIQYGGWSARISSRTVERRVKYYASASGIKEKVTPHSMRHGWAHHRRDQGAQLKFIQQALGHLNPASTFVYEQYSDMDFVNRAKEYLI